ncbi:MAG: hypothetical protein KA293_12340 [Bacteroidia bacterium]|nr:hypothetical protein [Bacteroidia bacterium]
MPDSSPEISAKRLPIGGLLFMLAASLVLGMALLSRFNGFKIYDDAYMFVRYADHLLAGHGLVWNIGEGPVYGATSLAYVLALIPFRLLFPDNPAAALFSSSFFWGLTFLLLVFRMGLKTMQTGIAFKPYVAGLLFLTLLAAGSTLRAHFASGMETTFVLSYLTLCLLSWENLRIGKGNAWLVGILGGCAWWIRPDLLIFTWGVPMAVWVLGKTEEKNEWLRVILVTAAFTGIALLGAKMLTGAWLPLSFFAKSTSLYGPEFASQYRGLPLAEAMRFMGRIWPLAVLLGLGVYIKWSRLRTAYSPLDKAIFAAMLVFGVYFTFFVLQIMGFGQRFYYPLLPFFIYLGIRELLELPKNLAQGPGLQFKRIPHQVERIGTIALAGLLIYYGISFGINLKTAQMDSRFAVFNAKATYRAELTDYWAHLDALENLPNDLEIATTEVGMPAALYPKRKIHDLAALNNPKLLDAGLSAASVLKLCPADLIYMPHKHYVLFHTDLMQSKDFAARYVLLDAKTVKASMGVAIRRNSPYAEALLRIFQSE